MLVLVVSFDGTNDVEERMAAGRRRQCGHASRVGVLMAQGETGGLGQQGALEVHLEVREGAFRDRGENVFQVRDDLGEGLDLRRGRRRSFSRESCPDVGLCLADSVP